MIAIPFIYFLFLLIFVLLKKRTFDVSAYIISLYLVSAFFSILVDVYGLRIWYTVNYEITLAPTVLYCGLLTLLLYPFIKLPPIDVQKINPIKPKYFNAISYFYITIFFIIVLASASLIVKVLTGDMSEIRRMIAQGEADDMSIFNNVPTIVKPVIVVSNVFASVSMVMLLFYFYSICFLKRSKMFNFLLLLSSTTIIIFGIIGADRSKIIYWSIAYGFFTILFWKVMTVAQKKRIRRVSWVILSLVLFYFLTLTFQRFNTSEEGSGDSMIYYAGQSFIHFCYFFDEHPYQGFTLQKLFPLWYKLFVDNDISSSTELNRLMSNETGIFHGIFNTFIGDIMMASNSLVATSYCILISLISGLILRNNRKIDFHYLVVLFFFSSILLFGLFVHYYAEFTRVICFYLFVIYGLIYKGNKKYVFK